jgi:hypothetical protein
MISRDEIRHLCLEHDRFMAEARESLRMPLIYKDCDNGALAAALRPMTGYPQSRRLTCGNSKMISATLSVRSDFAPVANSTRPLPRSCARSASCEGRYRHCWRRSPRCRVTFAFIRPHALAFARAYAEARADLAAMNDEHQRELADLRRELAETRALFDELRAVTLARQRADAEVAELYRLRDIERAKAAERDPVAPLN